MAIRHLVLAGVLAIASATVVVAQQTAGQNAAEFRRMLAMGTKYKTASELYAALKAAAPRGGRQTPTAGQLPDWSGLWTAANGGSFFGAGPGGVTPKLT